MDGSGSISVLHTEWSDGWGGQEIRILGEMLLLRERGASVYLSGRPHAQITREAKRHGIMTFDLRFRGMLDFMTMIKLVKIIKKHQISIVNTHSGKDTWLGGIAAKLGGAKFIRTRHLAIPINPSRFNFINSLADHIITTGDTVREAMIRDNRILTGRITSIPTMPNHEKFDPKNYNRLEQRNRLGLDPRHVAVGIVGVLRRVKRIDLFICMAEKVSRMNNNARFFIVGEGPLAGDLKTMVKQKQLEDVVFFTGHLDEPAELMAALDVYTQTSDSETTTQTIPQALLMGLPVVSTDVGSIRQIHDNDNFILVQHGDVEVLAREVLRLVESEDCRKLYASKSRASVKSDYSADKMADKILEIYHQLLERRAEHHREEELF